MPSLELDHLQAHILHVNSGLQTLRDLPKAGYVVAHKSDDGRVEISVFNKTFLDGLRFIRHYFTSKLAGGKTYVLNPKKPDEISEAKKFLILNLAQELKKATELEGPLTMDRDFVRMTALCESSIKIRKAIKDSSLQFNKEDKALTDFTELAEYRNGFVRKIQEETLKLTDRVEQALQPDVSLEKRQKAHAELAQTLNNILKLKGKIDALPREESDNTPRPDVSQALNAYNRLQDAIISGVQERVQSATQSVKSRVSRESIDKREQHFVNKTQVQALRRLDRLSADPFFKLTADIIRRNQTSTVDFQELRAEVTSRYQEALQAQEALQDEIDKTRRTIRDLTSEGEPSPFRSMSNDELETFIARAEQRHSVVEVDDTLEAGLEQLNLERQRALVELNKKYENVKEDIVKLRAERQKELDALNKDFTNRIGFLKESRTKRITESFDKQEKGMKEAFNLTAQEVKESLAAHRKKIDDSVAQLPVTDSLQDEVEAARQELAARQHHAEPDSRLPDLQANLKDLLAEKAQLKQIQNGCRSALAALKYLAQEPARTAATKLLDESAKVNSELEGFMGDVKHADTRASPRILSQEQIQALVALAKRADALQPAI